MIANGPATTLFVYTSLGIVPAACAFKVRTKGLIPALHPVTCPLVCVDLYGVFIVPLLMRYLYMCAVLPR